MTLLPQATNINAQILDTEGEEDIIQYLSNKLGFTKSEIESSTRKAETVHARDIIAYLLREHGGMSYPAIGHLLGGRDHTTAIHAYKKIKKYAVAHSEFDAQLIDLIEPVKQIYNRKHRIEQNLVAEFVSLAEPKKFKVRRPSVLKAIPERNLKILDLYREGLTLQNISNVVGITRERVRQVVLSTIKQIAVNESISKGIVVDSEVMVEELSKTRQTAKNVNKPLKPIKAAKRWSKYHALCKLCGTTSFKHAKHGLCERCTGNYRPATREKIINQLGGHCQRCGMSRAAVIAEYGRDFYISKEQKILCRGCFLKSTGRVLGHYNRSISKKMVKYNHL